MKSTITVLAIALLFGGVSLAQNTQVLLAEDFEGLQLGPNVDEGVSGDAVWTNIPPTGWIRDDSGVPGAGTASDGVTEWAGWGFADKDWWVQTAGNQDRSLWEQGNGTVMITDPDEWDDAGHPAGEFNAFISTAPIDLSLAVAGTAQLSFDSSWRDYAQQTGTVTVSYDGGAAIEVLLLDSEGITAYVPPENETITVDLNNPAGAQSAVITFGMTHAGNDWWWAVDNILVTADIRLDLAYNPTPRHRTDELSSKMVLGWTPGQYVGGLSPQHRVLLSADRDAIENGTAVVATLDANSFDATGLLDYSTTYYWRIDEANRASDWDLGGIWEFTTEPYSIPVETVTATASSSNANMGPDKTINGIGLNELDQHSTESTDMWLSGMGDATPSIEYAFDKPYKLHEMWVWNSNQLIESFVGLGAKDVVIEYSLNGTDWSVLENAPQFAQANGSPTYTANTAVDFDGALAQYVKITVQTGWGVLPQFGLSEVRFYYIPTFAREPLPAVGAMTAGANVALHWRAGREAVSHQVYLGTDPQNLALIATTGDNTYAPSDLAYDSSYYWQIVEINEAEIPSAHAGEVWNFSTPPFFVVDDFEAYDDDCERIFFAWLDGIGHNGAEECGIAPYNGNGTGSIVGHSMAPFAEQTIVHGDGQSMPLEYDSGMSETAFSLDGQNWAGHGIKSLSVYFHGAPDNTGQLYLKINNTKVAYNGDPGDIKRPQWQPWIVDLSAVGGNLQHVTSLTIGVENASGSGMLYIDDICLYPLDREMITPTEPDAAGLVALYEFEGTANDGIGANHGATVGDPAYAAGAMGQAISLDGFDDYVQMANNSDLQLRTTGTYTVSAYVKVSTPSHQMLAFHGLGCSTWASWYLSIGGSENGEADGMFVFGVRSANGGSNSRVATMAVIETWVQLTATYDGSTLRLYLDGVEAASLATTIVPFDSAEDLYIGADPGCDGRTYSAGLIDDLVIYSRALSPGEVLGLAGKTTPVVKPF